jgi:hydrogenase maturation factor
MIVVGDFHFDIQAGKAAGAVTVFIDNGSTPSAQHIESDYRISNLKELKNIIRMETPLPAGKFPNDLLEAFLGEYPFKDPSVLIHPGVGEDTAAIDVNDEEVLILKSDPITFATDAIGEYAVLVNANDIATAGATPRWFLTTLLFPCGTVASDIWQTMTDLQEICQKWGITLCGGHTEITDSVNRPVITGMLAGTVLKENLIDKRNIKTGDRVLLTKSVAVEGTAIIAREFDDKLEQKGMSRTDIDTCKAFLSQISILPEAGIAGSTDGVSAMHDITEGGIATAAGELSIAGRHKIRIDMDQIPVFPQTKKISRLLDIDPMGLIGSGSLLICCRKSAVSNMIKKIQTAGIQISCIGEVLEPGQGISATKDGKPAEWPSFEVDEITRLF